MKKLQYLLFIISGILFSPLISAAEEVLLEATPSSYLSKNRWSARWITCPEVSVYDYGVYHFRKSVELEEKPESFVINISADNRYRLFVNGTPVCFGPARGDISHWYYETVELAPFFKEGKNTLAVEVWNFGEYKPGAQMSLRTGLIVQGNSPREELVNTDDSWKVIKNKAYTPSLEYRADVECCDIVLGNLYPWGWQDVNYDDKNWSRARMMESGEPYGTGVFYHWVLAPRDIPLMEEKKLRMKRIRRVEGVSVPESFLEGESSIKIEANKKVSFLIDQTYLTTAYPEITVSEGKGSQIRLIYGETLYKDGNKGNRNEVEGKTAVGLTDYFYPDGGNLRLFRPLWLRTYRYIQVDIETKDEPLVLQDIYGMYTGYPFVENGSFGSNDISLNKIWDVGWRTARLCAHETYFDCPYYEQLQYLGDTRIQALISLYVDGDDRLMRKAIKMFDYSRTYEGLTASRYPGNTPQYIPPFSLYWINMVHDYWMYRDDNDFVKSCIPGIKSVLEWFISKIDDKSGMLGALPHWNFVDWAKEWPWNDWKPVGGVPPGGRTGGSAIVSLQLAYTLKDAIELLSVFGERNLAEKYKAVYTNLCDNVYEKCWDHSRGLLADDLNHTSYSQHVNIMAILSDAVPIDMQTDLFDKLNMESDLIQSTFYYKFYLFRAMKKVGKADLYITMLKPWYDMLDMGLTTFAENPEPTRSDCHAWSASPVYDLLATVCGVEPAEPNFRSIKVEPHLGVLETISGKVPHPKGIISVNLKKKRNKYVGSIILPQNVRGKYILGSEIRQLKSGNNIID